MFPAYYFDTPPKLHLARSVSNSPPRVSLPHSGAGHRRKPVAKCTIRRSQSILGFSLPFGIFAPPARSAQTDSEFKSLPLRSARFPLAPRWHRFLSRLPPDHRSGSATFRPARCRVNLLEPSPLCPKLVSKSNKICMLPDVFLNLYNVCLQQLTEIVPWKECG